MRREAIWKPLWHMAEAIWILANTAKMDSATQGVGRSCAYRNGAARRKTEGGELPVWVRHGMEGTRLYKIWDCMKQRCTNQNSPNFENYGGRGITVCKEWEAFVNFLSWAEKSGYKDTLSLDRENNDGPYSPDNCRWSTRIEQQRNKGVKYKC